MSIGFQGMHDDNRHIMYKNEGGGFQRDELWQDGLCYQFYFRNNPYPEEYVKSGLYRIQYRVLPLFDTVKDKHQICGIYNI